MGFRYLSQLVRSPKPGPFSWPKKACQRIVRCVKVVPSFGLDGSEDLALVEAWVPPSPPHQSKTNWE